MITNVKNPNNSQTTAELRKMRGSLLFYISPTNESEWVLNF